MEMAKKGDQNDYQNDLAPSAPQHPQHQVYLVAFATPPPQRRGLGPKTVATLKPPPRVAPMTYECMLWCPPGGSFGPKKKQSPHSPRGFRWWITAQAAASTPVTTNSPVQSYPPRSVTHPLQQPGPIFGCVEQNGQTEATAWAGGPTTASCQEKLHSLPLTQGVREGLVVGPPKPARNMCPKLCAKQP